MPQSFEHSSGNPQKFSDFFKTFLVEGMSGILGQHKTGVIAGFVNITKLSLRMPDNLQSQCKCKTHALCHAPKIQCVRNGSWERYRERKLSSRRYRHSVCATVLLSCYKAQQATVLPIQFFSVRQTANKVWKYLRKYSGA